MNPSRVIAVVALFQRPGARMNALRLERGVELLHKSCVVANIDYRTLPTQLVSQAEFSQMHISETARV